MRLIDFKYRDEFAFWEYRYGLLHDGEILAPTKDTLIKQVVLTEPGTCTLEELLPCPSESAIIMITSPQKEIIWSTGDGKGYRARCYTKMLFDPVDKITINKLSSTNIPEEFFIIQGNLDAINLINERTGYKRWNEETEVQRWINKPCPTYIKKYDKNWSIMDNDSELTIINHTDAGWWFDIASYSEWYNPYVLTWRKAGANVLSWRTPYTTPFSFGFEMSPTAVAKKQAKLIKEHFPKTKRVIYFGQCLGTPFTIATASHYPNRADGLYTSATIFNPMKHRSKNLMALSGSIPQDTLNKKLINKLPYKTQFLYKSGDECERNEHGRFVYELGAVDNVKHYVIKYTDVYAPVVSSEEFSFFNFIDKEIPNTEVDVTWAEGTFKYVPADHNG